MTASQEWCGNPNAKPLMADGIGIAVVPLNSGECGKNDFGFTKSWSYSWSESLKFTHHFINSHIIIPKGGFSSCFVQPVMRTCTWVCNNKGNISWTSGELWYHRCFHDPREWQPPCRASASSPIKCTASSFESCLCSYNSVLCFIGVVLLIDVDGKWRRMIFSMLINRRWI